MSFKLVVCLTIIVSAQSRHVEWTPTRAQNYLSKYGYLLPPESHLNALLNDNIVFNALKKFQSFAGLNVTGELTAETMATMSLPCCGVPDIFNVSKDKRLKRYTHYAGVWKRKVLTYRISKYSRHLPIYVINRTIKKAFGIWAAHIPLRFIHKMQDPVDIEIRFERLEHGDCIPFDGLGGVLAHSCGPDDGGDLHFDDDEIWSVNSPEGTDLLYTSVHEIGHVLGLGHSDESNAVMNPYYHKYTPNLQLNIDDILGIQSLYGKKKIENCCIL